MTPADYEPPGFKAAETDNFMFEDEPMGIKVGEVATVSRLSCIEYRNTGRWAGWNTLPVKVHDATLRPLLNIMDSASLNPVADATVHNLLSPIVI